MNNELPTAKSTASPEEREKLRRIVERRGLCGLANDTKWDELILAMRTRTDWKPSYRCKCIDGPPSAWDSDWFYHLPFPLMSVEWMDVSVRQQTLHIPPRVTNHSAWIEELLSRIGLNYHKGSRMIRIFGYSPKSLDLFDQ